MSKTYTYQNFHEVDAAVVFCIDPRFWPATLEFLQTELGLTKFDPYTFPGGPLCLVRADSKKMYFDLIEAASINLHHAPKIILISHAGCGGYKLLEGVEGEAALAKQTIDLQTIKAEFIQRFPGISVETFLLKTISETELTFDQL